jgi:hypothetical protein
MHAPLRGDQILMPREFLNRSRGPRLSLFAFCDELHRNLGVSDATYARAVGRFGDAGVIDTLGITGVAGHGAEHRPKPLPDGATPPLVWLPR